MSDCQISRRRWLQSSAAVWTGATSLGTLDFTRLCASDAPKEGISPLNRFPRMVHEYYVRQVAAAVAGSASRLNSLNKSNVEKHLAEVRQRIGQCFGPWPERTPLNAKTTGVVERDTYRIEKVIFESRPEFYVTANLYVPKGLKGKTAGIVGSCGHSPNGKAIEAYQSFAQGLVRQGYVSLLFDPIGQGERLQFPDENLKPKIGPGVSEHMMVGNQQFLIGEFFGAWRAWDGMRALDYLLSREEVDPKHVGITGNSGGGTMTTWLCGVEQRWTMAAPSCFVTSFLNNMENELPADTEQCPPGALAQGLDHWDFLAAMAPKPIVILAQEKDFFDVRGTERAYHQLKRLYAMLGAEENVSLFVGPGGHGYAKDAREAMYSCFNKATGLGESPAKEPKLTIEDDATLQCTKRGQIVDLKGRTVYSYTQETAERLARERPKLAGEALAQAVRTVLKLEAGKTGSSDDKGKVLETPRYRILRPRSSAGAPLPSTTTYLVEVEPGIEAPVSRPYATAMLSRPPRGEKKAVLYVAHDSSDAELRDEPLVREVLAAEEGAPLYAVDVRGLGESRPNTCGENSYRAAYGCDYFYSSHAIMLDRPYVGRRTLDLLRVLDWLKSLGHEEVHIVGKGYGSLPAAYAALLHDMARRVTLKHALPSYQELASTDVYAWPISSMTPDILKSFDLPDVYNALAAKQLKMIEPKGAADKTIRG